MTKKERDLESMLRPTVEALGCRIWGLEFFGHGRRAVLRIYIDRDAGVTVDDCERVSKQVSGLLDVEDALAGSYTLEVSSPGLDRVLFRPEQYAESIGEVVDVRLAVPLEGRRRFVGRLNGLDDGEIAVQVDEESEVVIPLESVMRARVVPQFESAKKLQGKGQRGAHAMPETRER
jgi:ribosome maturation factor RimP